MSDYLEKYFPDTMFSLRQEGYLEKLISDGQDEGRKKVRELATKAFWGGTVSKQLEAYLSDLTESQLKEASRGVVTDGTAHLAQELTDQFFPPVGHSLSLEVIRSHGLEAQKDRIESYLPIMTRQAISQEMEEQLRLQLMGLADKQLAVLQGTQAPVRPENPRVPDDLGTGTRVLAWEPGIQIEKGIKKLLVQLLNEGTRTTLDQAGREISAFGAGLEKLVPGSSLAADLESALDDFLDEFKQIVRAWGFDEEDVVKKKEEDHD